MGAFLFLRSEADEGISTFLQRPVVNHPYLTDLKNYGELIQMQNVNTKGNTTNTQAAEEKAAARKALWKARFKKLVTLIGTMRFWHVAGLCFLFRVFVTYPIGTLLALVTGTIWGVSNLGMLRQKASTLQCNMAAWTNESAESLWFKHEGRQQILALINQLSAQGTSYCNLTSHLSMPPKAQWNAIRNGLHDMGIVSQIAGDSFYITWHLPGQQSGQQTSENQAQ